jgi:hypothetical protein
MNQIYERIFTQEIAFGIEKNPHIAIGQPGA